MPNPSARGSRLPIRSVVLIAVARVLPILSQAYADGTTEAEVSALWEPRYRALMRGEARDHEGDAATNSR